MGELGSAPQICHKRIVRQHKSHSLSPISVLPNSLHYYESHGTNVWDIEGN